MKRIHLKYIGYGETGYKVGSDVILGRWEGDVRWDLDGFFVMTKGRTHASYAEGKILACELTAAGRWFIFMNFFVHSIMYTYYSFTAYGIRPPRVLSMCITALQTSQMLVGVAISITVLNLKLKDTVSAGLHSLSLIFHDKAGF